MSRAWWWRVLAAFGVWTVVLLVARVFGGDPDPVLIGLGIAAVTTLGGVVHDTTDRAKAPTWDLGVAPPVREPGEDRRLGVLARLVSLHLDAREVDGALQRELVQLADHRLVMRHGIAWRSDPEAAAPLLGPELVALAEQRPPYPRMNEQRIDVLLRKIEAL